MLKAARERLLTNEITKEEEISPLSKKLQETQEGEGYEEIRKKWIPTYAHPWPDEVAGLGLRHIGAFDACSDCGTGSWVRYGWIVLCLACSMRRIGLGTSAIGAPLEP